MELDVEPFSLPLATPLRTARGSIDARSGYVVRVRNSAGDGAVGVGEATPLPGWTEPLERCRSALDEAGRELARRGPDAALAALSKAPAARHGLELALLDLRARREGQPLYRALGGDARVTEVPVNATVGDGEPGETAARALAAAERGTECCKLKVGARSVDADERRLRAVRDAVGDSVAIRLDANGAWSPPTARRALDRFAEHDVAYVEQPLPADALGDHARLRDGDVGVALDESLADHDVDEILAADAADVLVCKPTVLGGPRRTVDLARRARAAGIDVVVSNTVDGVLARTGAVHVAAALAPIAPCGLATGTRLADDLAPDPARVAEGRIRVPQDPGTGVSLDAFDAVDGD